MNPNILNLKARIHNLTLMIVLDLTGDPVKMTSYFEKKKQLTSELFRQYTDLGRAGLV